jgi:hypothetical protein
VVRPAALAAVPVCSSVQTDVPEGPADEQEAQLAYRPSLVAHLPSAGPQSGDSLQVVLQRLHMLDLVAAGLQHLAHWLRTHMPGLHIGLSSSFAVPGPLAGRTP